MEGASTRGDFTKGNPEKEMFGFLFKQEIESFVENIPKGCNH